MKELSTRLVRDLDANPDRAPLLVGGCGTGRTSGCLAARDELGRDRVQYIDLERAATTPERFLHAVVASSPFLPAGGQLPEVPASPREAYDEALKFLATACTRDGRPATFLLDEVLELRTFESFPGLRAALPELAHAVDASPNRFVLTTRYETRGRRLIDQARSRRLDPWPVAGVEVTAVADRLRHGVSQGEAGGSDDMELARLVHALGAGRPLYVESIVRQMAAVDGRAPSDPVSALSALLAPGERLDLECRCRYEMRLQRARGYGALRAILAVLAVEEPLNLTAIARHMQRTAGSTKDYLMWLCDVDLVAVDRKRYSFRDPLLRLWVRLQTRTAPPDQAQVAAEVHRYALERSARGGFEAEPPAPPPEAAAAPPRAVVAKAAPVARAWKEMEID